MSGPRKSSTLSLEAKTWMACALVVAGSAILVAAWTAFQIIGAKHGV